MCKETNTNDRLGREGHFKLFKTYLRFQVTVSCYGNHFSFGAQQENLPLIFRECTPTNHMMSCDQCDYGNIPFPTEGGGDVRDCHIALGGVHMYMHVKEEGIILELKHELQQCSPIPITLPPRRGCRVLILLHYQGGLLEPRQHELRGKTVVHPVSQTGLEMNTLQAERR